MKNTFKKLGQRLKNKYVVIGLVVVLVAVGFFVFGGKGGAGDIETADASVKDVTEKVAVTGKVAPFQRAELGFEKSGSVATIPVKVGQVVKKGTVLVTLSDNQGYASLVSAQAALRVAEANLADNVVDTNLDYANAQRDALNDVRDAFVSINSAILTEADTFFENGTSVNPTLTVVNADSYTLQRNVENKRLAVTRALDAWRRDIDTLATPADAEALVSASRSYLVTIQDFTSTLYAVVASYVRNSSAVASGTGNTYLETINTANTSLNTALSSITTAANNLASTKPKSTESLRARVDQARADVGNYEAQYGKSIITAPFDGVVVRIDPEIGDVVGANEQVVALMTDNLFKVEVNVPEVSIARIAIGDHADITLDAYGDSTVFGASVFSIDPAETVIGGVATYKVTLQFDAKDDRIRSGMTANIDIVVDSKTGVVAVPSRAIISKDGQKIVRVMNADGKTYREVPVEVGVKGSDGTTEIVRGIDAGTTVVTFVKE